LVSVCYNIKYHEIPEAKAVDIIAVVGESGTGKTTLAKIIMGLLKAVAKYIWRIKKLTGGITFSMAGCR